MEVGRYDTPAGMLHSVGQALVSGKGSRAGRIAIVLTLVWMATGCGKLAEDSDASTAEADLPAPGSWLSMGGNLSSTFHNTTERDLTLDNAGDLEEAWRLETMGAPTGVAAVVDGVVYLTSGAATYALQVQDGAEIWSVPFGATSSPAYHDGALYVHGANAELRRMDAATGEMVWQVTTDDHALASGTSSAVVVEDLVIVGLSSGEEGVADDETPATFRGSVVAYDIADGAERWRYYTVEAPFNGATVWSTVSVDLDARLVFATTGNNYTGEASPTSDAIIALNLDDGSEVWVLQTIDDDVYTIVNLGPSDDTDFGTNPILFEATIDGEVRKLVGAGQKSGIFYAADRLTGKEVWSRELSAMAFTKALTGGVLNNGAFDGERILVVSNAGASDAPGGEPDNGESGVGMFGGFISPKTSVLYALDPASGDILWERQLPAWVWAPITVAGGVGFVPVGMQLEAFNPETGQKIARHATAGTVAAGASIVDGRVFMGSGMSYFEGTYNNVFRMLSIRDEGAAATRNVEANYDPTFTAIYEELIAGAGCNSTYCHGSISAGALALDGKADAYTNLVGAPVAGASCVDAGGVRVVPGDPDASLLLDKLGATPSCGDPMPPGAMVSAERIEQVRAWIAAGAKDD